MAAGGGGHGRQLFGPRQSSGALDGTRPAQSGRGLPHSKALRAFRQGQTADPGRRGMRLACGQAVARERGHSPHCTSFAFLCSLAACRLLERLSAHGGLCRNWMAAGLGRRLGTMALGAERPPAPQPGVCAACGGRPASAAGGIGWPPGSPGTASPTGWQMQSDAEAGSLCRKWRAAGLGRRPMGNAVMNGYAPAAQSASVGARVRIRWLKCLIVRGVTVGGKIDTL